MSRIAIMGNTAGGKSTLSRRLSESRDLPYVEVDAMFWGPDWEMLPAEDYHAAHDAAIAKDHWIIDGVGNMPSLKARAARATELILLDLPLWLHYARAAERQMAWQSGRLQYPPSGGQVMPPTEKLFAMMWEMDRDWMPKLRALCDEAEAKGKSVTRLTSADALDAFSEAG